MPGDGVVLSIDERRRLRRLADYERIPLMHCQDGLLEQIRAELSGMAGDLPFTVVECDAQVHAVSPSNRFSQ